MSKYFIFGLILLSACGPSVVQINDDPYGTEEYKNMCSEKCLKKFKTKLHSIGVLGSCFCE